MTNILIAERKLQALRRSDEVTTKLNPNTAVNAKDNIPHKNVTEPSLTQLRRESQLPLAQRLRPKNLEEFYGQEKLVGPHGLLRNLIASDNIPSFILWGVPGVGKTSLARIIAHMTTPTGKFVEVSGVDGTTKRLREVFQMAENEKKLTGRKTIIFIDEIHRFNKAIQDILLPVIEKGTATIIGATTENPSFNLNNALLSRMHTFTMEPLLNGLLVKVISRGLRLVNKTRALVFKLHLINLSKDAIDYIAKLSTGDSRVALNILESVHAYLSGVKFQQFKLYEPDKEADIKIPENLGVIKVTMENLKPLLQSKNFHQMYDRHGDSHYDTISAFHKSVRGSDPDAAIFYLVKMLQGGEDPMFIIRRMIVIASEDIGLRDSSCLPFAIAAKDALEFVGMPEGEIILAHCATKLARAFKSTKSYRSLRNVQSMFNENPDLKNIPIPIHLRNAPTALMKELGYGDDYKYNPNFENGLVKQSYLPKELDEHNINKKFVEDTHLGTTRDTEVPEKLFKTTQKELDDYKKYKEIRRTILKEREGENEKDKERERECGMKRASLEQIGKYKKRHKNGNVESNIVENERHSYDEFLSHVDQPPQYIDGQEKNEYSDDPDCTHNFECSYDENFSKEVQPRYEEDDTFHYDPEYPIFYD